MTFFKRDTQIQINYTRETAFKLGKAFLPIPGVKKTEALEEGHSTCACQTGDVITKTRVL